MLLKCNDCGRSHHQDNAYTTCTDCKSSFTVLEERAKELLGQLSRRFHSLNEEINQLKTKLKEVQPRLNFLQFPFRSGQAEGNPKSDVVIFVQGQTDEPLYAHKTILAFRSSVFRKMFDIGMMEEETGIVRIDDATLPVVIAVIGFCYHGEIDFTEEITAEDVLAVAHKYAIEVLQQICEEHMSKTINNCNLPKRLKLATKFQAKGLQTRALDYLKQNFDEAIVGVVDALV